MRSSNHGKEERFLIVAARVRPDVSEQQELEWLVGECLDWRYLFFRARIEGVPALIHHHIKKLAGYDSLPENVKEWARQAYFQNLARNTNLVAAIKEVSGGLRTERIDTLALKGIYLAEHIYGDIALRPIGDIDLVIRKSDLEKANDVLVNLGYSEPLNIKETIAFNGVAPFNSLAYPRKGDPFFAHLHWHLINSTWPLEPYVKKMDMESIWARSESVLIGGASVRALSPEHQVIYLVNHGFHHFFSKLIVCADVRETLITLGPRLNPETLKVEARRFGMEGIMSEGLGLVADKLSCDVCRKATRWFGDKPIGLRHGYHRSYAIYLLNNKGIMNKARFLYGTLFPQPIVLANSMGIPLGELKTADYLKRLIRI